MNPDSIRPTGHELVVAIVGVVAVLLVLPVIAAAGNVSWWMVIVALGAAAFVFLRRDSGHGLAALAGITMMWLASDSDPASPWSLAVALLMFTTHTSLALRTTAPPGAPFSSTVVLRWLGRSAVICAVTAVVYLLVFAFRDLQQADAEVILALALAMLGALILLLRSETLDAQGMRRREQRHAFADPDDPLLSKRRVDGFVDERRRGRK
jgi:membrane-bound ClpP family serine protease